MHEQCYPSPGGPLISIGPGAYLADLDGRRASRNWLDANSIPCVRLSLFIRFSPELSLLGASVNLCETIAPSLHLTLPGSA